MSAIQEINNTLFMTTAIDCWHKLRKVLVQELFAKIVCHNIMVFTNFVYYIHFTYYILHVTYAIVDPSIRCKLLSDVFCYALFVYCVVFAKTKKLAPFLTPSLLVIKCYLQYTSIVKLLI